MKNNYVTVPCKADAVIVIDNLTKDYGHGRGAFDVTFTVEKGECFGFLGPNGAGKTTTIRHLMGFSKPQDGKCTINGLDCWEEAAGLKNVIGYLPGEIAFPAAMTGKEFLEMMKKMRGMTDDSYCSELLKRFELDPDIKMEEMSLGMRRKLAVVTAFMHDPEILILDEPTSGLDPIMQQTFIDYIVSEKTRGKTILLSSHIFHEVEAACDRIAVIKDGRIQSEFVADELKETNESIYQLSFDNAESYQAFIKTTHCDNKNYNIVPNESNLSLRVTVKDSDLQEFLQKVAALDFKEFKEVPFTLEDYFMGFYKDTKEFEEVR